MRTLIITFVLSLLGTANFAQTINIPTKIAVREGKMDLDGVQRNGFGVDLVGEEKAIIKSFEDFLEDRSKKYNVKSFFKKISGENILVPAFSDKHFNVNAEVRETESTIALWYWVSFGTDVYVNTTDYPQEASKCKALLTDFAKSYFSDFIHEDVTKVRETMESTSDNLENIVDDIEDLTKDKQKEEKSREKLEQKKQKLESNLAELQIEIAEKDTEIQQIDAEVRLLITKINEKENAKRDIERQIASQEETLIELQSKLASIEQL